MEAAENRVSQQIDLYAKADNSIAGFMGGQLIRNRATSEQKLKDLHEVYRQFAGRTDLTAQEQATLGTIRGQVKGLERHLYPNRIFRYGRRLLIALDRGITALERQIVFRLESGRIAGQLESLGCGLPLKELRRKLGGGEGVTRLGFSHPGQGGGPVDYEVKVVHQPNGRLRLDGMKASVTHSRDGQRSHYFSFRDGPMIGTRQALHLLEGRPVNLQHPEPSGNVNTRWLQLDFNQRDQRGTALLRELNGEGITNRLKEDLRQLPLVGRLGLQPSGAAIGRMQQGERVSIKPRQPGGPVFMEAGLSGIVLVDREGNRGSISDYLRSSKQQRERKQTQIKQQFRQLRPAFQPRADQTKSRKQQHRPGLQH